MKVYDKIRKWLNSVGLGLLISVAGTACQPDKKAAPVPVKPKTEKIRRPSVKNSVLNIKYRTDTLERRSRALLYYTNGKIIRNYVKDNDRYRMQLPLFVHEKWHDHNAQTGFRNYYLLTPYEYFKLCMHDEISANLAAVLTARYEYLSATEKERPQIIKEYENTYMGFYFKAVKDGSINPLSTKAEDNKKEWYLLANGTRDMWMKKYAPVYAGRIFRMLTGYIDRKDFIEDSKKNYISIKRKMYTIGGIDFLSYMEKDIDYDNDKRVLIKENQRKVKSLAKINKEIQREIDGLYAYLKDVHISRQQELFQHIFIAAKMKLMLKGVNAENLVSHPQIITSCYHKAVASFKRDKTFKNFVKNTPFESCGWTVLQEPDEEAYKNILQKIYTFNKVDLLSRIKDFAESDVPVITQVWDTRDENHFFISPYQVMFDDSEKMKLFLQPVSMMQAEGIKPEKQQKAGKVRISDTQYIDIPNFFEPILVGATAAQQQEILDMVKKFREMPEVLKSCRTADIQKYRKQHLQTER